MGAGAEFAKRIAPKGRPPTADELWGQRALRAEDTLGPEQSRRHRELMREVAQTLALPRESLVLVKGRGWQPNPHRGDHEYAECRQRELWAEIGQLLGIGPPPWCRDT